MQYANQSCRHPRFLSHFVIIPNVDINKYIYKYIAVVDQFTC